MKEIEKDNKQENFQFLWLMLLLNVFLDSHHL